MYKPVPVMSCIQTSSTLVEVVMFRFVTPENVALFYLPPPVQTCITPIGVLTVLGDSYMVEKNKEIYMMG